MHNKEQQQQTAYFKQLADVIKNYDAVVLFGPTDAKAQLYNILKADNPNSSQGANTKVFAIQRKKLHYKKK